MIRDDLKDAKYFEKYIAYQTDRISKKKEKLAACGNDEVKADRIRLSLLKYQLDMLFAKFSAGEGKIVLGNVLEEALDTACTMNDVDYESLLNLLSVAIFLDKEKEVSPLIKRHNEVIVKDKLLNCLAVFSENGSRLWNGEFQIKKVFDNLNDLDLSSDKTATLQSYLDVWYDLHAEASWYDSHKEESETYVGYWSFESAALVKIFELDNRKLKTNRYFPSL